MVKYELRNWHGSIIRVLAKKDDQLLIIDCIHRKMPVWVNVSELATSTECSEEELYTATKTLPTLDCLSPAAHRIAHERYTLIAGILPFVADERLRTAAIQHISIERNISKQTLRHYLCLDSFCPISTYDDTKNTYRKSRKTLLCISSTYLFRDSMIST